jgi:hypothetical protein
MMRQLKLLARAYWDMFQGFMVVEYWSHQCRINENTITTAKDNRCYYCGLGYKDWLDEKNR